MTYGTEGNLFYALTSLDVAAHELVMHYVKTANLAYQRESGNE
jgi:Zn-dependent metalloprotease